MPMPIHTNENCDAGTNWNAGGGGAGVEGVIGLLGLKARHAGGLLGEELDELGGVKEGAAAGGAVVFIDGSLEKVVNHLASLGRLARQLWSAKRKSR